MLRDDKVVFFHSQIVCESFSQCRQESQWASTKQDGRLEVHSSAQRNNRLYCYGMENTCRDILFGQVASHQVLYISLGEHATARCHGISLRSVHGQFAHALVVYTHQHRHLVNEGSCTACAIAIHAQFHVLAIEKHHFGIFASDVYQCLCLWITIPGEDSGSYHLLGELNAQLLCGGHADTTSHAHADGHISYLPGQLVQVSVY